MNEENTGAQPGAAVPPVGGETTATPVVPATPAAPVAPTTNTAPATADTVAARLAAEGKTEEEVKPPITAAPIEKEPTATEPPVFDLSKLSPDMLIALKAALENAPLRQTKKGNPILKLRRLDGRFILDFKNCIQAVRKDELTQITSEIVLIPVRYMGEEGFAETNPDGTEKWVNVDYKLFMNADQVKCEVVATRNVEGEYSEGEVESNERPGVMVELEVKTVKSFFTVKLPEGSPLAQVEIEAKIANA